jgi:membrane protein implicated in regulation of membrane protease activity
MPTSIYIGSLCFGAVFLMASLFMGGDSHSEGGDFHADADAGGDFHADADADMDADGGDFHADADADGDVDHSVDHPHENLWDHGKGGGGAGFGLAWLPLTSMRFWVFFLTFFGASGALLQGAGLAEPTLAAGLALGFGYLVGVSAVNMMRQARRMSSSTLVEHGELVGKIAKVVVPIEGGRAGKIVVQTRTGEEEFIALASAEDLAFSRKDQARIERFEGGRAVVAAVKA